MRLWFVVFATLVGGICLSKKTIEVNESYGLADLEESAIQILTTCYAKQDKTIVLAGNFSGNFVKSLSAHRSFSILMMDEFMTAKSSHMMDYNVKVMKDVHKVSVVAVLASNVAEYFKLSSQYQLSIYHTVSVSVLVIGWSPQTKLAVCDEISDIFELLWYCHPLVMLNIKFLCRDRTQKTWIYTSNPFTNHVPEPWQLITSLSNKRRPDLYVLNQEYRKREGMCKNLDFDRTGNLGGWPISVMILTTAESKGPRSLSVYSHHMTEYHSVDPLMKRYILDCRRNANIFETFIKYINATENIVEKPVNINDDSHTDLAFISFRRHDLRTIWTASVPYNYPRSLECRILITHFRGNKSQLQKILSVIDRYSWVGMGIVYLITLLFFKYFLRQTWIAGIMNICRLTCNFGLTTVPSNLAPQIYLACLLFFVVTMQGIFTGNLAALLTQDIPLRQVNTVKDLVDLGYTAYIAPVNLIYFDELAVRGRVFIMLTDEDCLEYLQRNFSIACFAYGIHHSSIASELNLHLSDCLVPSYSSHLLPWNWVLTQRFDKFMAIATDTGTSVPLDAMVAQKRLDEAELEAANSVEPRVIILGDLLFAFVILSIGLVIAFITFIGEIIIHLFHRRAWKTRVIVLN